MIVEDDKKTADVMLENIIQWGYEGIIISDFNNVFNSYARNSPHLVLMDINLPLYDGFYWCDQIRQVSGVPIIYISSKSSNMDIVMAINMGGDDFITKPFSLEVLMAKISVILRRSYSYIETDSNLIEHEGVVLNLKDNTLMYNEQRLELTKNESKILYVLMKDFANIITREKIMRSLWEDDNFIDDNTLTVNINRFRKKLKNIGLGEFIKTKKNQGYIIL